MCVCAGAVQSGQICSKYNMRYTYIMITGRATLQTAEGVRFFETQEMGGEGRRITSLSQTQKMNTLLSHLTEASRRIEMLPACIWLHLL